VPERTYRKLDRTGGSVRASLDRAAAAGAPGFRAWIYPQEGIGARARHSDECDLGQNSVQVCPFSHAATELPEPGREVQIPKGTLAGVFSASPETIRSEPRECTPCPVAYVRDLAVCASMILMYLLFHYQERF
jgi:hypothetical protein